MYNCSKTYPGFRLFYPDSDAVQLRFYSQDPTRYFWAFICFDGTVQAWDSCTHGYFDLLIHDYRQGATGEEINLDGLPWGDVSDDLDAAIGERFASSAMKYIWRGPGISLKY